MNADRNNINSQRVPVEPLPIDFDPSLIEVDRLLARSAGFSANDAPAGLSQRVFEMSVSSLPSARTAEPALQLIEADDESRYSFARHVASSTRWRLGWAAMAASVLLVAGVTSWMNWQPSPVSPIAGNSNGGQPGGAGDTTPTVRMASVDFSDLNRIAASNPSEIDAFESEFTYLLDASEVRSFNDLNNDLRQFVAQLEMEAMLSRLTNAVLMLAVIVLSVALWRSGRAAPATILALQPSADIGLASDLGSADNDDVLLLTAAFAPFDASELEQATTDASAAGDAGATNRQPEFDRLNPERRDAGRGHDRRWSGGDATQLTEEMANRCLEVARQVDPEIARQLADARANNPEEFDRQMRAGGFGRRLLALAQLKTHDPLLYGQKISELSTSIDIDRTARELRELKKNTDASLGRIAELETNLRTLLQVQLALSIKARGDMVCRFEERLERMKEDISREARNFQSTIDARMKFLMEQPASPQQPVLDVPVKPEPAAAGG